MVECPETYLPPRSAVDFDRTAAQLGPFGGSDRSTIKNGLCYTDSDFFSDDDIKTLGSCAIYVFDQHVQGHFLWAMRTELEPKWDYS